MTQHRKVFYGLLALNQDTKKQQTGQRKQISELSLSVAVKKSGFKGNLVIIPNRMLLITCMVATQNWRTSTTGG